MIEMTSSRSLDGHTAAIRREALRFGVIFSEASAGKLGTAKG